MMREPENRGLIGDQRGITMSEYLVLVILLALAGLVVWKSLGKTVNETINDEQDGSIRHMQPVEPSGEYLASAHCPVALPA